MYGRIFTAKGLRTAGNSVRETITLPLTEPILIRLHEPLALLPAGIVLHLPRLESLTLIRKGLCSVVGNLSATADVVVTEDELEDTGLLEALDVLGAA